MMTRLQIHLHLGRQKPESSTLHRYLHRSRCLLHRRFPRRRGRHRSFHRHNRYCCLRIPPVGCRLRSNILTLHHRRPHLSTTLTARLHRCHHHSHCLDHHIFQEQKDRTVHRHHHNRCRWGHNFRVHRTLLSILFHLRIHRHRCPNRTLLAPLHRLLHHSCCLDHRRLLLLQDSMRHRHRHNPHR